MCRVAEKDANYNIVDDFITTTRMSVLFIYKISSKPSIYKLSVG